MGVMPGSRILEIDPETKKVVWSYSALDSGRPTWDFYTAFMGSAQRLPNGNTLIDEAMNGRIFQVTPKGQIVWEYVSPYFRKGYVWGVNNHVVNNASYRAQAVSYDWAPPGTPHEERSVTPPNDARYRVDPRRKDSPGWGRISSPLADAKSSIALIIASGAQKHR